MQPIKVMRRGVGGGGGPSITIDSGTYTHAVIDPANATCTFEFQSDGDCAVSAGVTPTPVDWINPGGVGVGADYDVSWNGGGAWENLATNRNRTVSRTIIGTSNTTYSIQIRNASTLAVLATGTITLEATVDV